MSHMPKPEASCIWIFTRLFIEFRYRITDTIECHNDTGFRICGIKENKLLNNPE